VPFNLPHSMKPPSLLSGRCLSSGLRADLADADAQLYSGPPDQTTTSAAPDFARCFPGVGYAEPVEWFVGRDLTKWMACPGDRYAIAWRATGFFNTSLNLLQLSAARVEHRAGATDYRT